MKQRWILLLLLAFCFPLGAQQVDKTPDEDPLWKDYEHDSQGNIIRKGSSEPNNDDQITLRFPGTGYGADLHWEGDHSDGEPLKMDLGIQHNNDGINRIKGDIWRDWKKPSEIKLRGIKLAEVDHMIYRFGLQGEGFGLKGHPDFIPVDESHRAIDKFISVGCGFKKPIDLSTILNLGKNTLGAAALSVGTAAEYRKYDKASQDIALIQQVPSRTLSTESDWLLRGVVEASYHTPEVLRTTLSAHARFSPKLNDVIHSVSDDHRTEYGATLSTRLTDRWNFKAAADYLSNLNPRNGAIGRNDETDEVLSFGLEAKF